MTERWEQIPWMPVGYEASSEGRIRRSDLNCTFVRNGTVVTDLRPARYLIGKRTSRKGYQRVRLGSRVYQVHRIVAELFVSNADGKPHVNHKNGNKLDNRAENLEWVTNQENRHHAVQHGLHAHGEALARKLSNDAVVEIRRMAAYGVSQSEIAAQFEVAQQTVSKVISGKAWRHVSTELTSAGSGW